MHAKTFAIWLAERSTGQGEKHLLTHDVFKQQTALVIIPYFGLIFGDGSLSGLGVCIFWPEEEVEVALERYGDGIDTACAEHLELTLVAGADADIFDFFGGTAMFDDEVGLALNGKGPHLPGVGRIFDDTGCDVFVKKERLVLQVKRFNEHVLSLGPAALQVNSRRNGREAAGRVKGVLRRAGAGPGHVL